MTREPESVNRWLITLAVMVPTLIEILDTSVANVALKHIQGSLAAGEEEVTWVLTSYLVANAIVIPMSGWLARLMGRKRFLMLSIAVFTASSLLCGAATTLPQIILFRIFQGLGGGGLQPMSQAILMETFPPQQRGMAMGIFGVGVVLGPILGPLMGGYLTDNFTWRWIFYINLPVGLLALYLAGAFLFDPPYMERRQRGEAVDYIGLALLTTGIGALQIVLDKGQQDDWFSSPFITTLAVVSAVSLVVLVFWELRHPRPVLDFRILKNRSFAIGNVVMFFGFFAFFGSIVLLPLFLQGLMGYTAYLAGLVLGPGGMLALVFMPVAGKLTERIDARWMLAFGMLVCAYSLHIMAGFNLYIDFGTAAFARVLQGIAMPFFFVSLSVVTFAYVPREAMNTASPLYNLLRNLGGSFGVAFVTTLLARRTQYHHSVLSEGMTPLSAAYQLSYEQIRAGLAMQLGEVADLAERAQTLIYQMLQREASALAFNDAFLSQGAIFVVLFFCVWFMRRPPRGKHEGFVE